MTAQQSLRVLSLSGEELVTVYFQAPATIRQLKEALKDACNLPRFRQKLLLQQRVLADDQDLDQVLDLQLVKLSYTAATDAQIEGLLRAAADGAVDRVEDILQRPQNPNDYLRIHLEEHTDIYASALSFAARENHTDVMQLLAPGSDIALWLASRNGHQAAVRVLLEARADVDCYKDSTALYAAAEHNHPQVVQVLLESIADVRKPNSADTWTPLQAACFFGHCNVAKLLLSHRADAMRSQQNDPNSPFRLALDQGHTLVVQLIQASLKDRDRKRTAPTSVREHLTPAPWIGNSARSRQST
ncbi:ankrd29 [Symbiodinium pilosum]|uniref:Ankrd29 protein n=1 Tax=Symbiodinium pilosum TaxID=2952 RepID=A0A812IST3_SYMPI|nr:ankrd29 [Symbiodinium pilosum]